MDGFERDLSWLLLSANPNSAGSPHERKRIVADDLSWTFQLKLDCVGRKRANRAEFIRDAQDDSSRVRTVGNQFGIVGKERELDVNTRSRETLRNHQLPLNVPIQTQISPFVEQLPHFKDEWCVAE